jgi:hypothetical protein
VEEVCGRRRRDGDRGILEDEGHRPPLCDFVGWRGLLPLLLLTVLGRCRRWSCRRWSPRLREARGIISVAQDVDDASVARLRYEAGEDVRV